MGGKKAADVMLLDSIAGGLLELVPCVPKQLFGSDELQRTFDLPWSQIQLLLLLRKGGMTVSALAAELETARPNVSPMIAALQQKKLICREADDRDGRISVIRLTEGGQELTSRIQNWMTDRAQGWSERLNRSELREMNEAVSTLLRLMKAVKEDT